MKTLKIIAIFTFFLISQGCEKGEKCSCMKLGIDVLEERKFDIIQGKSIGILTSKAGVDSKGQRTWKVLKDAPGVTVKAIFAPVHGLDCKFMSLETFYNDDIDGIPVYSTYASNSKPKDDWLRGLDAVVVDLQDLGIRYYNYWAFMLYMMAACFERGIEVIVLDRPNPLGGLYIGGPAMDEENTSVWGPIVGLPLFHGMTIGELAAYCKNTPNGVIAHQILESNVVHSGIEIPEEILNKGKLTVIPMKGWRRKMAWEDTRLKWIQSSPMIPNLLSSREYAFVALSTFVYVNCGFDNCNFMKIEPDWDRDLPFHSFFSKYAASQTIINHVHEAFKGSTSSGVNLEVNKKNINKVDIVIRDIRKTTPGLFGLAMLALAQKHTKFYINTEDDYHFLGAHIGDEELMQKLSKMERIDVEYFKSKWQASTDEFIKNSKPFYLYD